jgi:hypothetical protein
LRAAAFFLLVVTALVAAGSAGSTATVFVTFQTPSKNIGCGFSDRPNYLRCDIDSGLKPLPPRPASCDVDFGIAVGMATTGRARALCVGDSVRIRNTRVLRYGSTWRRAGFTCVSRRTGLRCANRSGHGFFLSRARSQLF